MSKITEVIDSLNDENASEVKEQLTKEAIALNETNRQLYSRAKKAEGFEKKDGKWVKKEVKQEKLEAKNKPEPDELGLVQKTFLIANGIKGADEQAKVFEFMEDTGKSLEDAVENKYLLAELKDFKDDKASKAATPNGSRGAKGGVGKDSVDYWLSKGEMPPKDNPKLQREYVNARIAKERGGDPFAK